MKKITLFLGLALLALGCESLEQLPEGNITFASESEIVFPTEGGTAQIAFTTDNAWNAYIHPASATEWCTIDVMDGPAGEGVVVITALDNETYSDRSANVRFNIGSTVKDFAFSQVQLDELNVSDESKKHQINGLGGTFSFDVNANIDFTYDISADWISVVESKALEASTLTFNVALNPSVLNARTATVTVKSGDFEEVITVNQDAIVPEYEFSSKNIDFSIGGGDQEFTVSANIGFTVLEPEEDWLSLTKIDDNNYKLTATALSTYNTRSAYVYLVGEYEMESGAVMTVTQKGGELIWSKRLEGDYSCVAQADEIMCLAEFGDKILLGDSFDIAALDLETGAFLQQIALPEEITALGRHTFDSDDAGHVVLGALYGYVDGGTSYDIFYTDATMNIQKLCTYDGSTYNRCGNFKASGDVTKNGVVTGFVDLSQYWVAWEFVDGEPTFYRGVVPEIADVTVWYPGYASVEPVGTSLADGLIYSGYAGNYNMLYCADPKSNTWVTLYPGLGAWDWACIGGSYAEFGGKKFIAAARAAFASSGQTGCYLIDVTDPAAPAIVYELSNAGIPDLSYLGLTGSGDAEIVVTDDAMYLVCVDGQFNVVNCVKFPKI